MKLTKDQEEFIGSTFNTPKGGVLTVVGVSEGKDAKGWWDSKFTIICSICSTDKELYPVLKAYKRMLKIGSIPCGCSKSPRFSEQQFKILVKRKCNKLHYKFYGWGRVLQRFSYKIKTKKPKYRTFMGYIHDQWVVTPQTEQ